VQKLTGKFLAPIFLGSRRHPPYLLSSKDQTINAEYYSSLLAQLKDILKGKRSGKFTEGPLFFHCNDIGRDFNVKPFGWNQTGILPKNVIVGMVKKTFPHLIYVIFDVRN
jgi:hypothetical protein